MKSNGKKGKEKAEAIAKPLPKLGLTRAITAEDFPGLELRYLPEDEEERRVILDARATICGELFLKYNLRPAVIADKLELTEADVREALDLALESWRASREALIEDYLYQDLQRIALVERAAWEHYYAMPTAKDAHKSLELVLKCLGERRKILKGLEPGETRDKSVNNYIQILQQAREDGHVHVRANPDRDALEPMPEPM